VDVGGEDEGVIPPQRPARTPPVAPIPAFKDGYIDAFGFPESHQPDVLDQ
jgi:hypothetical protein